MSTPGNWWENLDESDRLKVLETAYAQRLMSKYFSDKDISGGKIFDEEMRIGDQTIKSSRSHSLESYLNPIVGFKVAGSASTSNPVPVAAPVPDPVPVRISMDLNASPTPDSVPDPTPSHIDLNVPLVEEPVQSFGDRDLTAATVLFQLRSFDDPNAASTSSPVQNSIDPNASSASARGTSTTLSLGNNSSK